MRRKPCREHEEKNGSRDSKREISIFKYSSDGRADRERGGKRAATIKGEGDEETAEHGNRQKVK
jgi:hypothetical protein